MGKRRGVDAVAAAVADPERDRQSGPAKEGAPVGGGAQVRTSAAERPAAPANAADPASEEGRATTAGPGGSGGSPAPPGGAAGDRGGGGGGERGRSAPAESSGAEPRAASEESREGRVLAEDDENAAAGEPATGEETSDGDEEEEEEEDEEEEEEEPKLKFRRLGNATAALLKKDAASSVAVSARFVALGTHWGVIHILDFDGNEVKRFRSHAATVNHLSIDNAGEYVASASDDGKVVVNALYTPEVIAFDYRRPVKCVAIDPEYSRKSSKQFVSGGMAGQLIMNEKGWFTHKDTTLHSGEGPIISMQWRGNLIAWSNDVGVNIYDVVSAARVAHIDRPQGSPRPDLYKCHLRWKSDDTLLIGWANWVEVARVRERPRGSLVAASVPTFQVDVLTMFQTDYIISGVAPFRDMLLLLTYTVDRMIENEQTEDEEEQRRKVACRPELRIVDSKNEELSSDALSLTGFEYYQPNDYVFDYFPSEDLFYVVSPKDLVVAQPRDLDDHIGWLLGHFKYEEALAALEEAMPYTSKQGYTVESIGQKFLSHLVELGEYDRAAALCSKVLSDDARRWEDWVFRFTELRQLKAISPYIPVSQPQLSSTVYEMVIAYFLSRDYHTLLTMIRRWPASLYDANAVVKAVRDRLAEIEAALPRDTDELDASPDSSSASLQDSEGAPAPADEAAASAREDRDVLMRALAELYVAEGRPGKALEYQLRLGDENAVDLVREHNLFSDIRDKAVVLMEFDRRWERKNLRQKAAAAADGKEALARAKDFGSIGSLLGLRKVSRGPALHMMVTHTDEIPVPLVVDQLFPRPALLHTYLDAVFERDASLGSDFHDLQVELYAEFERSKLLDFLKASNYYSLEKSYAICEQRDLVPEMVFILGRMGNNTRALGLIIERMGDVERAIEFATTQDDPELWEDLLAYSLDKPAFIKGLLENAATHVDPVKLIRRVPEGLEIPGLKGSLQKILFDYNLQSSLLEGSQKILVSDSVHLADELHRRQKRGMSCSDTTTCAKCENAVFDQEGQHGTAVVFFCRHAYHDTCLVDSPLVTPPATPADGHWRRHMEMTAKIDQSRLLRGRGAVCPSCREAVVKSE